MRMKHLLPALLLTVVTMPALLAQPGSPAAKVTGPDGSSRSSALTIDAAGANYSTGFFSGTVDFDPGPGITTLTAPAAGSGCYIVKLNAAGDFVWVTATFFTSFGARSTDIAVDLSGNVYVTGSFNGTVDFNPGPGTDTLNSPTSPTFGDYGQAFILKLDGTGTFVWAKGFGGVGGEEPREIAVDGAGNVYTTGFFYGTADFDPGPGTFNMTGGTFNNQNSADAFVMSLNPAGGFRWAKSFGGTGAQEGRALAVSGTGVYSTGIFANTIDLDPGPGTVPATAPAAFGVYISRLDTAGNYAWGKALTNAGFNGSTALSLDPSQNVIVSGQFSQTMDFDPGPGTVNLTPTPGSSSSQDIYFLKLNSSGDFAWAKSVGGAGVETLLGTATDGAGNVYATGTFSGIADLDPGSGTVNLDAGAAADFFVLKADAAGAFSWAVQVGDSASASDIAADASGTCYLGGSFMSTVDFDPGMGVFSLATGGGPSQSFGGTPPDAFVLKLAPGGGFGWARKFGTGFGGGGSGGGVGIAAQSSSTGTLTLAPNPARNKAVLRSANGLQNAGIRVLNLQGQVVNEWRNANGTTFTVDISAQPAGMYVVEISQGSAVQRLRVLKQ